MIGASKMGKTTLSLHMTNEPLVATKIGAQKQIKKKDKARQNKRPVIGLSAES